MIAAAAEGGKASGLRRLRDAGFAVPEWVVVPADAQLTPPVLGGKLDELFARHPDAAFAVRSSSLDEDGSSHSFAGQFETKLNVPAADVLEAIAGVRASAQNDRVREYRRHNGLPEDVPIAVVIQVMVEPEVAGVAFGRDPIDGGKRIVISAVRGLGEALVSGEANADTVRVEIEPRRVERASTDEDVLTEAIITAVSDAALEAERAFGAPQDLEWAWVGGALYLLQSRPITTLSGDAVVWDNSNIAESYGGVVSPLTFSFARYAYAKAYRQMFKLLAVSRKRIDANSEAFEALLGLVEGRMYYHLLHWYQMLALLPGFTLNRTFMEQMMGVEEGLPESALSSLPASSFGARLGDGLAVAGTLFALLREQFGLPGRIERFQAWFVAAMRENADVATKDVDGLIAAFARIEDRLGTRWDAPLLNDFFTMIYFGVLRGLCRKWLGDESGTLQNELAAGTGDLVSAEPARLIGLASAEIASDGEAVATFCNGDTAAIAQLVDARPAMRRIVDDYLARFGDRCENELKLESVRLTEDPLPLYRAIGRTATAPVRAHRVRISDDEVMKPLRGFKRRVFAFVVRNARQRIADRENMRLDRTRLFGRVRAIFLALGRHYAQSGKLADANDVFMLTIEEALHPKENASRYASLVAERRVEEARFLSLAPPAARVLVRDGRIVAAPQSANAAAALAEDLGPDARRGIGCCAGLVTGVVALVSDPSMPFETGRILVTERTDPSWVMLFPAAAGILVERGSLLSHAAIVSREMNIPSVVAIRDLTRWLADGDRVEFDGTTGIVRKLP